MHDAIAEGGPGYSLPGRAKRAGSGQNRDALDDELSRFTEGDALAGIKLTGSAFRFPQGLGIVSQVIFLLGVNPIKKAQPIQLGKSRDGLLNLLHGAHSVRLA